MRRFRIKKEPVLDEPVPDEEVTENKLWPGMPREDLKLCLENRRFGHAAISPGMLLLQLQYGPIEDTSSRASYRLALIDAVMQFDDDAIKAALVALTEMGLY